MKHRRVLISGIVAGALLTLGPVWGALAGMIGTTIGMSRAFHELGKSGIGDPQALSAGIGTTLVSTAAGLLVGIVVCPVGIMLLVLSIVSLVRENRAPQQSSPMIPPTG